MKATNETLRDASAGELENVNGGFFWAAYGWFIDKMITHGLENQGNGFPSQLTKAVMDKINKG